MRDIQRRKKRIDALVELGYEVDDVNDINFENIPITLDERGSLILIMESLDGLKTKEYSFEELDDYDASSLGYAQNKASFYIKKIKLAEDKILTAICSEKIDVKSLKDGLNELFEEKKQIAILLGERLSKRLQGWNIPSSASDEIDIQNSLNESLDHCIMAIKDAMETLPRYRKELSLTKKKKEAELEKLQTTTLESIEMEKQIRAVEDTIESLATYMKELSLTKRIKEDELSQLQTALQEIEIEKRKKSLSTKKQNELSQSQTTLQGVEIGKRIKELEQEIQELDDKLLPLTTKQDELLKLYEQRNQHITHYKVIGEQKKKGGELLQLQATTQEARIERSIKKLEQEIQELDDMLLPLRKKESELSRLEIESKIKELEQEIKRSDDPLFPLTQKKDELSKLCEQRKQYIISNKTIVTRERKKAEIERTIKKLKQEIQELEGQLSPMIRKHEELSQKKQDELLKLNEQRKQHIIYHKTLTEQKIKELKQEIQELNSQLLPLRKKQKELSQDRKKDELLKLYTKRHKSVTDNKIIATLRKEIEKTEGEILEIEQDLQAIGSEQQKIITEHRKRREIVHILQSIVEIELEENNQEVSPPCPSEDSIADLTTQKELYEDATAKHQKTDHFVRSPRKTTIRLKSCIRSKGQKEQILVQTIDTLAEDMQEELETVRLTFTEKVKKRTSTSSLETISEEEEAAPTRSSSLETISEEKEEEENNHWENTSWIDYNMSLEKEEKEKNHRKQKTTEKEMSTITSMLESKPAISLQERMRKINPLGTRSPVAVRRRRSTGQLLLGDEKPPLQSTHPLSRTTQVKPLKATTKSAQALLQSTQTTPLDTIAEAVQPLSKPTQESFGNGSDSKPPLQSAHPLSRTTQVVTKSPPVKPLSSTEKSVLDTLDINSMLESKPAISLQERMRKINPLGTRSPVAVRRRRSTGQLLLGDEKPPLQSTHPLSRTTQVKPLKATTKSAQALLQSTQTTPLDTIAEAVQPLSKPTQESFGNGSDSKPPLQSAHPLSRTTQVVTKSPPVKPLSSTEKSVLDTLDINSMLESKPAISLQERMRKINPLGTRSPVAVRRRRSTGQLLLGDEKPPLQSTHPLSRTTQVKPLKATTKSAQALLQSTQTTPLDTIAEAVQPLSKPTQESFGNGSDSKPPLQSAHPLSRTTQVVTKSPPVQPLLSTKKSVLDTLEIKYYRAPSSVRVQGDRTTRHSDLKQPKDKLTKHSNSQKPEDEFDFDIPCTATPKTQPIKEIVGVSSIPQRQGPNLEIPKLSLGQSRPKTPPRDILSSPFLRRRLDTMEPELQTTNVEITGQNESDARNISTAFRMERKDNLKKQHPLSIVTKAPISNHAVERKEEKNRLESMSSVTTAIEVSPTPPPRRRRGTITIHKQATTVQEVRQKKDLEATSKQESDQLIKPTRHQSSLHPLLMVTKEVKQSSGKRIRQNQIQPQELPVSKARSESDSTPKTQTRLNHSKTTSPPKTQPELKYNKQRYSPAIETIMQSRSISTAQLKMAQSSSPVQLRRTQTSDSTATVPGIPINNETIPDQLGRSQSLNPNSTRKISTPQLRRKQLQQAQLRRSLLEKSQYEGQQSPPATPSTSPYIQHQSPLDGSQLEHSYN